MDYKVLLSENAEELLDQCLYYLVFNLNNKDAAEHFTEELYKLYTRMEKNPCQFPECTDSYLKNKGYRKAVFSNMKYNLIFRIENNFVYIVGIYHQLENYTGKVREDQK